ncbi:MAG: DUF2948 family protein [Rhodobacteraceae bacterium]|nr:DUF2948 family protein [Paracoccaceae bacterium]
MTDARFEDGADRPLRLMAQSADDVPVLSALLQDAIFPAAEMTYRPRQREFAILLNRFRWEDRDAAHQRRRGFERVQSVLLVRDVLGVASQGIDRSDADLVLSLMEVVFHPGEDGRGEVLLTLAGDGAIRLQVECLDLRVLDVTRPYLAPSGKAPDHQI